MKAIRILALATGLLAGMTAYSNAQSITRLVDGVNVTLPVPKGMCVVDANNSFDRQLLEGFTKSGADLGRLLVGLIGCRELEEARRKGNTAELGAEILAYLDATAHPSIDRAVLSRAKPEAIEAICAIQRNKSRNSAFHGNSYRERADTIMKSATANGADVGGFVLQTQRACYIATVNRKPDGTQALHLINVLMIVKRKPIFVVRLSESRNPTPVIELIEETKRQVIATATLNGEP